MNAAVKVMGYCRFTEGLGGGADDRGIGGWCRCGNMWGTTGDKAHRAGEVWRAREGEGKKKINNNNKYLKIIKIKNKLLKIIKNRRFL